LAVRGARFKAELTQKQLAEKLGVLPHHISEMEHGKRPISKKMAHKLAEVLDVNYKVFL
jgi:transcriptional regulator with XRE-family HTH domain